MKWLLSLVLLFAAVVAGLVTLPFFLDLNSYKQQIVEKAAQTTGLDIKLNGDLSLSLVPLPGVSISDVQVQDPTRPDEVMAKFALLDVQVNIGKLLQKQIDVRSITLEDPQIIVRQDADGQFNFMTSKLMQKQGASETSDEGVSAGAPQGASSEDFLVSFETVGIKNGSLRYYAAGNKEPVSVSQINLDIAADSLQGPFNVKGGVAYGEMPVSFSFKTGVIDKDVKSVSMNLDAAIDAATLKYAGVVSFDGAPEVQGELKVSAADLGGKGSAVIQGLVSADAKSASLKDVELEFGAHKASGRFDVTSYAPLSLKASLNGDGFKDGEISASQDGKGHAFDVRFSELALAQFGFDATAKGVSFSGSYVPDSLTINSLSVSDILGAALSAKGKVGDVKALSGLDLTVSGKTQDAPALASALKMDTKSWPENLKAVSFSAKATGSLKSLSLNTLVEALGAKIVVSGALSDPMAGLSLANLAVQVKHPNMAQALKQFAPGAPSYASLSGPLDFYTKVGAGDKVYTLSNIKADLAGASLEGSVKFDGSGALPHLSGDLNFGRLVLQSSKKSSSGGSSGGQGGGSPSAKAPSGGKWSSAPLAADWLHDFTADFAVKADSILYEGWDMDKPSLAFSLKDGRMDIRDLKAGLYDGTISVVGALSSAGKGQPVSVSGTTSIDKVNMEPLVQSLAAGQKLVKGSGLVSLTSDVSGTGASMKALIGSLKGQGSVSGSNIVLEGIDVQRFVRALSDDAKPGDTLTHLWKGTAQGGSTSFETLDGAYVINNGIVDIQKLLLDGPRAAIDTTGQVNLPAWTIKTAHKMSVKDRTDVPPFTMHIEGSLDNPANTFGQGAINDYLQRKIQRKLEKVLGGDIGSKLDEKLGLDGVLKGVLGGGAAQEPAPVPANDNVPPAQQQDAPPAQQQEIDPEEAVRDIIKGLF